MSGHIVQHPVSFRAQDVSYVMQTLLLARSCALIGVDGIGKSSFLRHLLSSEVRSHYLAERSSRLTFLLIDAHALAQTSALSYYRRMSTMLEQVLLQYNLYYPEASQLSRIDEEAAILTLFERVETLMIFQEILHLVFVFDEFTLAFTEVEPQFLRVLHALRGTYPGRISYLVTSRNVPILLCDPIQQKIVFQMFAELFGGYVYGLKPLAEVDAFAQLDLWLAQEQVSLKFSIRKLCIDASGAHLGLLKALMQAMVDGSLLLDEQDGLEVLLEHALRHPSILSQCELLWQSLSETEHYCLRYLHRGMLLRSSLIEPSSLFQEALKMLVMKGLLLPLESDTFQCFAPLFATFVTRQGILGLQLELLRQQVWIDGVLQTRRLTAMEFRLLRFLAGHAGEICSREETTFAIYGDRYQAREDAARLDALVERTRKNIGDLSRPPRFLETIRGIGHRLNNYAGERL